MPGEANKENEAPSQVENCEREKKRKCHLQSVLCYILQLHNNANYPAIFSLVPLGSLHQPRVLLMLPDKGFQENRDNVKNRSWSQQASLYLYMYL
jgi:hypothetical protein